MCFKSDNIREFVFQCFQCESVLLIKTSDEKEIDDIMNNSFICDCFCQEGLCEVKYN